MTRMSTNSSLLCIHRDSAQLSLLKEDGYELVTAWSGSDGLRLLMSQSVDVVAVGARVSLPHGSRQVVPPVGNS
jgi:hypothetical protein